MGRVCLKKLGNFDPADARTFSGVKHSALYFSGKSREKRLFWLILTGAREPVHRYSLKKFLIPTGAREPLRMTSPNLLRPRASSRAEALGVNNSKLLLFSEMKLCLKKLRVGYSRVCLSLVIGGGVDTCEYFTVIKVTWLFKTFL